MRIAIVLHNDTDAGIAQWLCKNLLLNKMPVELIFVPAGQRYENKDGEYDQIFHIDTGGIYDPKNGFLDHHGIQEGHPKYGKCSALLMMEYLEEQLGKFPPTYWTLAWFAQITDKEKDKEKADEYDSFKQDAISAYILRSLPKSINLLKRTKRPDAEIISFIDMIVETYLEQRKESEMFSKWYYGGLEAKQIQIITKTKFGAPALVAREIPYESGDFRNLVTHYLKAHSFIIGRYLPTDRRPFHRFGVNNLNTKLLPAVKLENVYRALYEKFPHLADDKNALFIHNDKFCLYLNKIPEGFTLEEFVKIVLTS